MRDPGLIVHKDILKLQLDRFYLTYNLIAKKFLKLFTLTFQ